MHSGAAQDAREGGSAAWYHTSAGRANTRRSGSRWQLAALAAAIMGLALPWLNMTLAPDMNSTSLPLNLTGIPTPSWLSYGLVCGVLIAAGLVVRGLDRPSSDSCIALIGVVLILVAVLFVVQTVVSDFALQTRILQDNNGFSAIASNAGYHIPRSSPRIVLITPITGEWNVLLGRLRLGWVFTILAGAFAKTAGGATLRTSIRRVPLRLTIAAGVLLIVCIAAIFRGIAANVVAGIGSDSIRLGNYAAAYSELTLASTLNDELTDSAVFEEALGRTLQRMGAPGAPTALLIASRDATAQKDSQSSLSDLRTAHQSEPRNPVISEAFDLAARQLALSTKDPSLLITTLGSQGLSGPADDYVIGVLLRGSGACGEAIGYFQDVLGAVQDPDIRSATYTQMALCQGSLGHRDAERAALITALNLDEHDYNSLARTAALGLGGITLN